MSLFFNYFFYYFLLCQGFASQFTEAGRRQFRVSSFALSNDCQVSLGASEALWSAGDLALSSQVNIWSWMTTIIRIIFIFYFLFWLFGQDWAARNLDLHTAGQHASNLWEVSCHCIKKKALIAGTCAQSMPFSFVLFALCHYYFILYLLFQKSKNAIWVRIHCRKLANRYIHHWGSVSIHTKSIKDSIIKHQGLCSHSGSWRNRPIGIGLADVREPSSPQFRLEPIAQYINRPAMAARFFCQTWSAIPSSTRACDIIDIISIIRIKEIT